ncbi:unnamed protein product, partial [Didymodactylos carnosus]
YEDTSKHYAMESDYLSKFLVIANERNLSQHDSIKQFKNADFGLELKDFIAFMNADIAFNEEDKNQLKCVWEKDILPELSQK